MIALQLLGQLMAGCIVWAFIDRILLRGYERTARSSSPDSTRARWRAAWRG